jgi:hypothetical protein
MAVIYMRGRHKGTYNGLPNQTSEAQLMSSPWNKKRPRKFDANPKDPTTTINFGLLISEGGISTEFSDLRNGTQEPERRVNAHLGR